MERRDDLIVGRHAVAEALADQAQTAIALLVVAGQRSEAVGRLVEAARAAGLKVEKIERRRLDQMAGGAVHQGVALRVAAQGRYAAWDELLAVLEEAGRRALVLVVDHVQDPHNLGAMLRSAAAAGALGVVVPKDRACQLTPAVAKAAAGALGQVAVCRVANISQALAGLKEIGLWSVAAVARGGAAPWALDLRGPLAVVVGSEHKGVAPLVQKNCDMLATLPLAAGVESLNASVAAGVMLMEVVRQRS
ncbi:RNA methyltransferase, TrmH family, group 3 [Desulfarculus baarsii DSM 2075]|uniref:RNA methyltransferase, TrmH family, group 3 n=1 Tax=Desulfarculus baarsii (strain ATCC 33931 / DSM 2075 / LMG 7858 / VKM B-1802 / 2st14) TaxID=644282 RepID=E1QIC3_DESB2|nr:23S rRNA (guanosine(2251)-2'-O)-methyltransferase RlmB [Desulfarculus baarsii]ADK85440.1 RNA methyltransferase, TrmH family, group 3 [Desulfarculus baarsii DSM 2075]